jgi:hypothetical protein
VVNLGRSPFLIGSRRALVVAEQPAVSMSQDGIAGIGRGTPLVLSKSSPIEDLVFHVDTGTFTCRTAIETAADRPLDDVLTYYREIGYKVAR